MTTNEAAAALQVSRRRINYLIELGTLKAEKRGRDWSVDPVSVEAYKNSPRKAGRKSKSEVKNPNIAQNIAHNDDLRQGNEEDKSD